MGLCVCALVAAAGLAAQAPAQAQEKYPDGPVTLIVPSNPGGPIDQLGRAVAQGLEKAWGKPVIVENKPGGGIIVGATAVARGKPDGKKLLINTVSIAVNPSLFKTLPYNAEKELVGVTYLAHNPYVLVARPRLGVKSVRELIDRAKKSATPLQFASPGKGTAHQYCMEQLQSEAGIKLTHIIYKGVPPALRAVLTDEIEVYCSDIPGALEPIKTGDLIPLAVTFPKRFPLLPDVPTMAEAGLPKVNAAGFYGIMTTAGTPKEIVAAIDRDIQAVIKEPEFQQRFKALIFDKVGGTPAEFNAFIKQETERYRKLSKAVGIEPE
jgi:tripartite-type tricarboxylate transporter receptor subunit TctC